MSNQYLEDVVPSYESFVSCNSDGLATCHLYAANKSISAHELFIL